MGQLNGLSGHFIKVGGNMQIFAGVRYFLRQSTSEDSSLLWDWIRQGGGSCISFKNIAVDSVNR